MENNPFMFETTKQFFDVFCMFTRPGKSKNKESLDLGDGQFGLPMTPPSSPSPYWKRHHTSIPYPAW